MTSKEALEGIKVRIEYLKENHKIGARSIANQEISEIAQALEEFIKPIETDLHALEELKEPYDEYENENYLCTRQAYYNNYLGELNYGYAIYKWDGTYKARTSKLEIKDKNWVEIFHAGTSTEKRELNEEYLEGILKLLESLKKTMEEKKCDIN